MPASSCSYIGLFSYYNFDNWTYQPSFVSSNNAVVLQRRSHSVVPHQQAQDRALDHQRLAVVCALQRHLGYGGQILYQPTENLKLVFQYYGVGEDNLGLPQTKRYHTDDSIEYKYFSDPGARGVSKMAFSFTADAGCQSGGGIHCTGGPNKSSFLGWMAYNRMWFPRRFVRRYLGRRHDEQSRPLPHVAAADQWRHRGQRHALLHGKSRPARAAMGQHLNLQYMPKQWITWWTELGFRHSNVPYFAGEGGVTPPGGNNGSPQYYTCNSGASAGTADAALAASACSGQGGLWYPDLRTRQLMLSAGLLVKF